MPTTVKKAMANAASAVNLQTNAELWNMLRKIYPQFAAHTAQGTSDLFTERGFDALKVSDIGAINEFFNLSMRVWLNVVNISHAKDILADKGFGEYYDQPFGGIVQRMATNSVKPVSPAYKALVDGSSVDPFVVRKPEVAERFWKQNFDYQSFITIPDDFQVRQIFISQYGMSEFMAGIMEGLQNGYTLQVYLNKMAAINAALNSTVNPLQGTQIQTVQAPNDDASVKSFLLSVKKAKGALVNAPQTGAFNALGFKTTQDEGRLKLLVRQGIADNIAVMTMAGAFNPEYLSLGVDIVEVPNFGGLEPYKEAGFATKLYPVYDESGAEIGFAETENAKEVTVQEDAVFWKDGNESVVALLADKGVIFECRQNPYEVEAIRNPRGRYNNYWASSPNNTIAYDPLYNLIAFKTA